MRDTFPRPHLSIASLITLFLAAFPSYAVVSARVISVHDGDTLTVLIDHRPVRVRLTDIDAPELGQPFGTRSRQSLLELCFGKSAALEVRNRDRYGRTIPVGVSASKGPVAVHLAASNLEMGVRKPAP